MKKFWMGIGKAALAVALFFGCQVMIAGKYLFDQMVLLGFLEGLFRGNASNIDLALERAMAVFDDSTNLLAIYTGIVTVAIVVCVFLLLRKNLFQTVGIQKTRPIPVLLSLVMGMVLFYVVQYGFDLLPIPEHFMQEYYEQAELLSSGPLVWEIMATVLAAPLVEELIFRGLVYRNLKSGMPIIVALIVQAAVFGAMHGHWIWMIYTFFVGLFMGIAYEKTGSLWIPIALHLGFNAMNYLPFVYGETTGESTLLLLVAVTLLAGLTVALLYLTRQSQAKLRAPS